MTTDDNRQRDDKEYQRVDMQLLSKHFSTPAVPSGAFFSTKEQVAGEIRFQADFGGRELSGRFGQCPEWLLLVPEILGQEMRGKCGNAKVGAICICRQYPSCFIEQFGDLKVRMFTRWAFCISLFASYCSRW